MSRSSAWTLVKRGENGERHQCTLCDWTSGVKTSTTNIFAHWEGNHPEELKNLDLTRKRSERETVQEGEQTVNNESAESAAKRPKTSENKVEDVKVEGKPEIEKERALDELLTKALCATDTDPAIIQNPWFRKFLLQAAPTYAPPYVSDVRQFIKTFSDGMKTRMKEQMSNTQAVLAVDVWKWGISGQGDNAIAAVFVYQAVNDVRKRTLISLKNTSSDVIFREMEDEGVKKVFAPFGLRICGSLTNSVASLPQKYLESTRMQLQCAAYSIRDIMSSICKENSIAKMLNNAKSIINILNESSTAKAAFAEKCKDPETIDFPYYCWIAAVDLLSSMIYCNNFFMDIDECRAFALQEKELPEAEFFVRIGELLEDVLDDLESESSTISTVIPHFAKLLKTVKQSVEFQEKSNAANSLAQQFHRKFDQKLQMYLDCNLHVTATLLDPRIAFQQVLPDNTSWKMLIEKSLNSSIFKRTVNWNKNTEAQTSDNSDSTFWTDVSNKDNKIKLSNKYEDVVKAEWKDYENVVDALRPGKDTNLLAWWSVVPKLRQLSVIAHQVLLYPGSVPKCEKWFLDCGIITGCHKKKMHISEKMTENLVLAADKLEKLLEERNPKWKEEFPNEMAIGEFDVALIGCLNEDFELKTEGDFNDS